jgi:hypothetical protein
MCGGYECSESHSMWSMLHPSAAFGWERLEAVHPATVAFHRTFFDAHNPAAVSCGFNMLYVERIQQLIMQCPHHRSLGNAVTMDQPPNTIRGSFYGTRNIFHIRAPATLFQKNVLRFRCRRCGYLSAYRRAVFALLRYASSCSNIPIRNVSTVVNTTTSEYQQQWPRTRLYVERLL